MIAAGMPRNQRAILACVGVVVLYGLAALLWFSGRADAWAKAEKKYVEAAKKYARENKLIASRAEWQAKAEEENVRMPVAEAGEDTSTRWRRMLTELSKRHNVEIVDWQNRPPEQHGDVWEMAIEAKYEAPLVKLVEFLYALNTAEGTMFDVTHLDAKPSKNKGYLSGKFTLTCAYMMK